MDYKLSPGTSDLFMVEANKLPVFGDLICDWNPLHRDRSVAKSMGFKDTPVFAVWIEAKAEEYLRTHNLTEGIEGQPLFYIGHSFKFKEAVYPEQYITFYRGERKSTASGVEVQVTASNDEGMQVLDSKVIFGAAFPKFEEPSGEITHVRSCEFSYKEHTDFHNLVEQPVRIGISYAHLASNIPAALLEKAFLQTNEEKPALTRGIDLKFHGTPICEVDMRTEIYLSPKAKNLGALGWLYNVVGVCYQREKAMLTGEMRVIYPTKLTI
ncbi:MAG: hypothetical protein AABX07_05230 [Nanoarchaeota archaeon]